LHGLPFSCYSKFLSNYYEALYLWPFNYDLKGGLPVKSTTFSVHSEFSRTFCSGIKRQSRVCASYGRTDGLQSVTQHHRWNGVLRARPGYAEGVFLPSCHANKVEGAQFGGGGDPVFASCQHHLQATILSRLIGRQRVAQFNHVTHEASCNLCCTGNGTR